MKQFFLTIVLFFGISTQAMDSNNPVNTKSYHKHMQVITSNTIIKDDLKKYIVDIFDDIHQYNAFILSFGASPIQITDFQEGDLIDCAEALHNAILKWKQLCPDIVPHHCILLAATLDTTLKDILYHPDLKGFFINDIRVAEILREKFGQQEAFMATAATVNNSNTNSHDEVEPVRNEERAATAATSPIAEPMDGRITPDIDIEFDDNADKKFMPIVISITPQIDGETRSDAGSQAAEMPDESTADEDFVMAEESTVSLPPLTTDDNINRPITLSIDINAPAIEPNAFRRKKILRIITLILKSEQTIASLLIQRSKQIEFVTQLATLSTDELTWLTPPRGTKKLSETGIWLLFNFTKLDQIDRKACLAHPDKRTKRTKQFINSLKLKYS